MNISNTRIFAIPEGMKEDLIAKIPNLYYNKKDNRLTKTSLSIVQKHLYIIHKLTTHKVFNTEKYIEDGRAFNYELLNRKIFGDGKGQTKHIFKFLIENNFIELVREQKFLSVGNKNNKSRSYRISHNYDNNKIIFRTYKTESSAFMKKLLEEMPDLPEQEYIVRQQEEIFKNGVSVDDKVHNYFFKKYGIEAENIPDSKVAMDIEDVILFSIISKQFNVTRPIIGSRIYSPLTSLSTKFRPYLKLNNERIIGIDVVNSQVLFSVILIEKRLKEKGIITDSYCPSDFQEYKKYSEKGILYESIAEKSGKTDLLLTNRRKFKENFYEDIFFSRVSNKKSKIKTAFKELFPSVTEVINEIKEKNGYNSFAIELQKVEARFMIDVIYKKLLEEGITALSLHDAIYTTSDNIEIVERLISVEIKKLYNISVTFKKDGTIHLHDIPTVDAETDEEIWFKEQTFKEFGEIIDLSFFRLDGTYYNIKKGTIQYERGKKKYFYKMQTLWEKFRNQGWEILSNENEHELINHPSLSTSLKKNEIKLSYKNTIEGNRTWIYEVMEIDVSNQTTVTFGTFFLDLNDLSTGIDKKTGERVSFNNRDELAVYLHKIYGLEYSR